MLNSKQATELVSKSLHGRLSIDEQVAMEKHLQENEELRHFADLSKAIHNSVSDIGVQSRDGSASVGPGLSRDAKSRLQDSVIAALDGSASEIDPALARTFDVREEDTVSNPDRIVQPGDFRESRSRFTLLRQIGEGGLGRVWLARDEKLNRNVALKEMNETALQLPMAWQRFNREAEITGQLEHPNVVSLYQYGNESRSGEPYYAMRFVGKRTLADAIEEYHERRRTGACDAIVLHRLLTAFLDVCQGIAYAHSRGVIHRDLKPDNIALDSFGQVIVLDWGLAKITYESEIGIRLSGEADLTDAAIAQTMAGEVIGTPLYMAPEQAAGDLDAIDKQTDVYGLGAILFAILTGVAPHESSHINSGGDLNVRDILKAIAEEDSPRPRDYRDSVPLELEQICRKAMAFKKYARYESAVALANDVERWMVDQGSRQSQYENLRLDGRELRNNVQSAVRDLETNVRFMSKLPPIQELIMAEEPEEISVWRERLSTIFEGMLNAKSDFRSVIYSRVDGDQFTELVRVERHSTDHSTIRSIPRSRLRTGPISEFSSKVLAKNPDEVLTSLACSPLCGTPQPDEHRQLSLVAGVPVFDRTTEEVFGVVLIECDLNRVLHEQLNRRFTAKNVVIACDTFQVIAHSNDQEGIISENFGRPLMELLPQFGRAKEELQSKSEYIDEMDRLVYGARLWLVPKKHGIMFLLSQ
ncbi:MAG: serine/threonine-protein kinase [Planctomycetota bacterium]